jgi:predicted GNAT family N-acyltransferase
MNFKIRLKYLIGVLFFRIKYPHISFKLIEDSLTLGKMYDLIWEVYANEKNYIDPRKYSKQVLIDEFEKNAIKIGAFNKNELIGTLRIILNSNQNFYVEKDFNVELPDFPREEIAELSRLVIKKNYRNNLISFGLLKKALNESKKRKIKYWIAVIPSGIKNYYERSLGIKFHPLKTKPLTERHLKIREKMKNYYIICNPLPYLINVTEI